MKWASRWARCWWIWAACPPPARRAARKSRSALEHMKSRGRAHRRHRARYRAAAAALHAGRSGPGGGARMARAGSVAPQRDGSRRSNRENVSDDLPDEYKICVYRLVQEALNNAVRHSRRRNARVRVAQDAASRHRGGGERRRPRLRSRSARAAWASWEWRSA